MNVKKIQPQPILAHNQPVKSKMKQPHTRCILAAKYNPRATFTNPKGTFTSLFHFQRHPTGKIQNKKATQEMHSCYKMLLESNIMQLQSHL
jgi:hypothetical protein